MCVTLCVLLSRAIQNLETCTCHWGSQDSPAGQAVLSSKPSTVELRLEQSGCMCKHLIAVVAPFHNTVNTQGGVRSPTENWIEIRWGEAERWSRRGEKGSQDSLGRHQLQIRYKYKYTNTQIHKNTNTKWSRGKDILRIPLGAINFRSAELMIADVSQWQIDKSYFIAILQKSVLDI